MSFSTVAQALDEARQLGLARLDAQLLLAHVLACSRSWLLAHDDALLSEAQASDIRALMARRRQGEPVAYLLGQKEFHGLMLQVSPAVLVPRPETEVLVDWALRLLAQRVGAAPAVLDLGTGSGAIALAVKNACPQAVVTALDASAEALAVARANAQRLRLDVTLLQSDWWQVLPAQQRFDLVLSNPPYVAQDDPHLAALVHEPASALVAGPDGLNDLRRIVESAPLHLHSGAWLLLEHGHDQATAVAQLLRDRGFESVITLMDLAGHPRCTGGSWC